MKFLVVWWYNYNKKYHMVLVIHFLIIPVGGIKL